MDRFIDYAYIKHDKDVDDLKSNMDRFIEILSI